jgi:hypothetical protein
VFQIAIRGRSSGSSAVVRSCEKDLQISIVAPVSPVVRLEVLSGLHLNPSSKLKLLGRVEMVSSGEVHWSVNDDSIVLSSISSSASSRLLPPSTTNSPDLLSLVIVGKYLESAHESTLVFTLSSSLDSGYSSSSSVAIAINSPPFGGRLEVNPVQGVMLETMFLMIGLGWVDGDLPLSYQFGYRDTSSPLNLDSNVMVRSKIQMPSTSSLLPPGPNEPGSNLTCVMIVFDRLDSSSTSAFEVSVEEVKMSTDELNQYLWNGINSSQLSRNSDDLKSTLSLTTAILNRVNCQHAPNCFAFNRMNCSTTEGTCGECLDGFLGLIGSSNTPCASSEILLFAPSQDPSSSGDCDSNVDCDTVGLFLECNLETHLCQSIQQSCPNSCSGHGRCLFSSKYNLSDTVDECGLLDPSCVSHCECETGFMGTSCSVDAAEFVEEVYLRHQVLESLYDLMKMENVEASNVKSWMKLLSSVSSSDYSNLGADSKILMSSLTIDVLRASAKLGLSIEDLQESGMNLVLDMCVSGLSSSLTPNREGDLLDPRVSLLMSLLRGYSDFVTSDMLFDQYPVSTVNPYFRSSSFSLSSSLSSFLSLPQTDFESLQDLDRPSISLPMESNLPLQITISETLVTFSSDPPSFNSSRRLSSDTNGTRSQLSLPLFISMSSSSLCSSGNCLMKVILPHKLSPKPSSQSTNSSEASPYFEADCIVGEIKDHEFMCPSGEHLVISCNGTVSGRARRHCPMRSLVTLCETSVQSSISSLSSLDARDLSCVFSSSESNESVTTCLCDLSYLKGFSDSSSVTFSLLSIEKSIVTDFVSTWETAPSLSSGDVAGSWVVLVTVGGVGMTFLLLILLSVQFDQRQSGLIHSMEAETKQEHGRIRNSQVNPTQERQLIEEALPSIFKSDSLWIKFNEEMKVYHRWLGIVFFYSPEFPRAMRVLSLFSSIVIMLFVQSVTYNIADPDDGSCESCDAESCCLSSKSTLNSNEDRCYWVSGHWVANISSSSSFEIGSQGSCHFRDIGEDMTRMFIVAIISAVVSAPLALSVQYLIMNVLSKQCVSKDEVTKENQRYQSRKTQQWRTTRQIEMGVAPSSSEASSSTELVENCGRTLLDDLNNLLNELSVHYASLLELGREKEDQAKEFQSESHLLHSSFFSL